MKTLLLFFDHFQNYFSYLSRLYYKQWLFMILFFVCSQISLSAQSCTLISGSCPSGWTFLLERNDYFSVDVYINSFAYVLASGIDLEISYSNTNIIIDEDLTEASADPALAGVGVNDFDFSIPGLIRVQGLEAPLCVGEVFVTSSHWPLFTIFFSGAADECVEFSFAETTIIVPIPSLRSYEFCEGGIYDELDEFCLEGFKLGGLIESPILDCE